MTKITKIVSRECPLLLALHLLRFPLLGCHACDGFEGAEEGNLVGKAGFEVHFNQLDVRLSTHQLLGIGNAVLVDEHREGALLGLFDAVGDVAAVGTQQVGNVLHLEVAVLVGTLFVHELTDALYQLVGCLRRQERRLPNGCDFFCRTVRHFGRSLPRTALKVSPSACDNKYQHDDSNQPEKVIPGRRGTARGMGRFHAGYGE